jgi:hypothetical protein
MDLSGAPIAVLENVDSSENISVGPGARWELPEGARAYLLDLLSGQGVRLQIDYLEQLRTSLHDLGESPRTAFGDSGRDLSGAALEVEIQPLVQRVRRKRDTFARFYDERNRRLLDLLERFAGEDLGGLRRTEPVWPAILPSDAETEARTEVALVAANIRSRRTAAANLGSEDPDAELDRIIEEAARLAAAISQPFADQGDDPRDRHSADDPDDRSKEDDGEENDRNQSTDPIAGPNEENADTP